jgi:hypothetical protein
MRYNGAQSPGIVARVAVNIVVAVALDGATRGVREDTEGIYNIASNLMLRVISFLLTRDFYKMFLCPRRAFEFSHGLGPNR